MLFSILPLSFIVYSFSVFPAGFLFFPAKIIHLLKK